MYHFGHPLPQIFTIFFNKTYIGQILVKDGYIYDLILYDCSYTDFMKAFLFELGVDEVCATIDKCYIEFYQDVGVAVKMIIIYRVFDLLLLNAIVIPTTILSLWLIQMQKYLTLQMIIQVIMANQISL